MQHVSVLNPFTSRLNQWRIQGEDSWAPYPSSPPIRPDACLRLKFLHRQDRISLFNWLIFFLMKQELHFATNLNSRDIKKCNCFSVPSYDLFACARSSISRANGHRCSQFEKNVVVSAFSAGRQLWHKRRMSRIQVHGKGPRNYNVQPRLVRGVRAEEICHKKFQQSFLNQSLDSPPPIK